MRSLGVEQVEEDEGRGPVGGRHVVGRQHVDHHPMTPFEGGLVGIVGAVGNEDRMNR